MLFFLSHAWVSFNSRGSVCSHIYPAVLLYRSVCLPASQEQYNLHPYIIHSSTLMQQRGDKSNSPGSHPRSHERDRKQNPCQQPGQKKANSINIYLGQESAGKRYLSFLFPFFFYTLSNRNIPGRRSKCYLLAPAPLPGRSCSPPS